MSVVPPDHLSGVQFVQDSRKSGRAVESDRGHTVWEWQTATGVFQRDVTDDQLRRLEAPHLKIVEFAPSETQHVWESLSTGRMHARTATRSPERRSALRGLWEKIRGE
ncbi:MAG: hypothetical protein ACJ8OJ_13060 [Povalibacter sp.]